MKINELRKKVIENPNDFQLCFNNIIEITPASSNAKLVYSKVYNSENCKVLKFYKNSCRLY